jgi:hypothetical protein
MPHANRRPAVASRSFLSSELCQFPTHSVHEPPHLRHRPSQIGGSAGDRHLPIVRDLPGLGRASSCGSYAACTYPGRNERRFEANFSHGPRRVEHFRGTFGVGLGKAGCGEQEFGVGNEAAQRPQVCSVWHNSSLSERGYDAERGQKQTCLFCYG